MVFSSSQKNKKMLPDAASAVNKYLAKAQGLIIKSLRLCEQPFSRPFTSANDIRNHIHRIRQIESDTPRNHFQVIAATKNRG